MGNLIWNIDSQHRREQTQGNLSSKATEKALELEERIKYCPSRSCDLQSGKLCVLSNYSEKRSIQDCMNLFFTFHYQISAYLFL